MYSFLKKYIKSIIPKAFLFKNELLFRYFYGIFYLGNKHQCTICLKKIRRFIYLKNQDLMCPFCGSLSRNRRLFYLLNENNNMKGKILHFSPARSIYRIFKKMKPIDYYSTDYENEFLADYNFDITNINQDANKFDVIICYHILEYILDDKKAISELYRVLETKGTVYIQTPFKYGDIYEDEKIISPEERRIHFGQEDHVRVYSIGGLKNRLTNSGFKVIIKTFNHSNNDLYFGFKSPETVLVLTK